MIDDVNPSLSKVRILIHLYVFVLTNGWWSMPNWYSRAVFNICSELTNYPNNFQTDLVISQFVLYSYSDVVQESPYSWNAPRTIAYIYFVVDCFA